MKIKAIIDLDELCSGREWGETVTQIIEEELKVEVRKQIKAAIKDSSNLKKAMKLVQNEAAERIIEELTKKDK